MLADMKLQKDFTMLLLSLEESKHVRRHVAPLPVPPPSPSPTAATTTSGESSYNCSSNNNTVFRDSYDNGAKEDEPSAPRGRPRNQNQVSPGERALWLSENARELSRQRWAAKEREEREACLPTTSSPRDGGPRGVVFAAGEEARKRKEQEEERHWKTKNLVAKSSLAGGNST